MCRVNRFGAVLVLSCALAIPALFAPFFLWEWLNHSAAQSILLDGVPRIPLMNGALLLIHPPSMAYWLALAMSLGGDHVWVLRFPGLCLYLLTGVLIRAAALEMQFDRFRADLAAAIYLTNPFVLQGMLSIDFGDGSLFPFVAALFLWVLCASRFKPFGLRTCLLGLCLCLALWIKWETAVLIGAAFLLSSFFDGQSKSAPRTALGTAALGDASEGDWKVGVGSLALGGCLFSATWVLYCLWVHSRTGNAVSTRIDLIVQPIRYLTGGGAAEKAWALSPGSMAAYFLSFVLYAGPMLLLAALCGMFDWAKQAWISRKLPSYSIVPLFALATIACYSLFMGAVRAFPKYYEAGMISLALMAAGFLGGPEQDNSEGFSLQPIAFLAVTAGYYCLVVGDFLYTVNFGIREAEYLGGIRSGLLVFGGKMFLYFLPGLALILMHSRHIYRISLKHAGSVLLIASQIGLCVAQDFGGYHLRYGYGASYNDVRAVEADILALKSPRPVMTEYSIIHEMGLEPVRDFGTSNWNDLNKIVRLIQDEKPRAVVYGLPINTVQELKTIRSNDRIQDALSSGYKLKKIGPFWVWLAKDR